ncbi:MAG: NAD(P)-dependent oxidoreductase [Candidatus Aenigmatarchaeota archaeon]
MKHLILGSSGQIGYHLQKYLREKNEEIIEFDIVRSPQEDLRIYRNPLLEEKMKEADFVHFLAFDVGGSKYMKRYQDTYNFISNNVRIMNTVFDSLKRHKKPFIFTSSQMSNMIYSSYGILKAIGERYTKSLGGLVVKLWNVYGIERDSKKFHVITDFIKMAKEKGIIRMKTDGNESRQFLFADDCCECLYILSKKYDEIDREKSLHITSFEWVTIREIAEIVCKIHGNCTYIPGKRKDLVQLDKKNEPDPYILQFWKPKTKLEEGIKFIYENI